MSDWKGPMAGANKPKKSDKKQNNNDEFSAVPMQPVNTGSSSKSNTSGWGKGPMQPVNTGSSKGKSSKTVSGNEKQGGNGKKQGFQAGPMQPAVIQKKKKSETLSRNELIEQLQSKEQTRIQKQAKSIDPSATYIVDGERIPGFVLQYRFSQEYEQVESKKYELQKYPKGTTFTKTKQGFQAGPMQPAAKEGYAVEFPEKEQLRYTEKTLEKTEKLPLGIKQFQQFRFGVESSAQAMFSPITNFFDKKTRSAIVTGGQVGLSFVTPFGSQLDYFTKRDTGKTYYESSKYTKQHFVSPLDVGFEPLGWSPKGSTGILKKYPVFAAGGVASEIGQGKAITAGLKGVSKGTKSVVKGISKVGDEIPEFGKITRTIGKTDFGKNIANWAKKGYKPTYALGKTTTKPVFTKTGDDITQTVVSGGRKVQKGTRFLSRQFVSPEDYVKAERAVRSKLGTRVDLLFPKKGGKEAVAFVKRGRLKGVIGKRLITEQKSITTRFSKGMLQQDVGRYVIKGMPRKGSTMLVSDDATRSYITKLKPYKGKFRDVESTYLFGTYRNVDDGVSVLVSRSDKWKTIKKPVTPTKSVRGTRATKINFFEQVAEAKPYFKKGEYGWLQKPSVLKVKNIDLSSNPMAAWAKRAEKARKVFRTKQRITHPFKSLLQERKGTVGLVPQRKITEIDFPLSGPTRSAKKLRVTPSLNVARVPALFDAKAVSYGFLGGVKIAQGQRFKYDMKLDQQGILKQDTHMRSVRNVLWDRAQRLDQMQDVNQDMMQQSSMKSTQSLKMDTMTAAKQEQKMDVMLRARTDFVQPSFQIHDITGKTRLKPIGIIPDVSSRKTKRKVIDDSFDFTKGYRFRTWKTPKMKDLFEGVF